MPSPLLSIRTMPSESTKHGVPIHQQSKKPLGDIATYLLNTILKIHTHHLTFNSKVKTKQESKNSKLISHKTS